MGMTITYPSFYRLKKNTENALVPYKWLFWETIHINFTGGLLINIYWKRAKESIHFKDFLDVSLT